MKIFKAGDKGRSLCRTCDKPVITTYTYRDHTFYDPDDNNKPFVVHDLLVGVCDECDKTLTSVHQPEKIKAALEEARKQRLK